MTSSAAPPRAHEVAAQLRRAIGDGVYTSGERLTELGISQELSVSQSTARDALWLLEHEGWVARSARRGVFVRSFTADEAEEIFDLWAIVEGAAFDWMTDHITRADAIERLRLPIQAADGALKENRWLESWHALMQFHAEIAEASKRTHTRETLGRLRNYVCLMEIEYEFNRPRSTSDRLKRLESYEQLLGLIKFGTSEEAQKALSERIREDGKEIIRWLAMHG
jgi:DNA-binding GntR family transcriptional regulator